MAQLKQYVCNFYKELQLGKDVKFRNGFFETDNPETQAKIESSQGFGVHIHFKDSLKEMERVGRERQEKEAAEKAERRIAVLAELAAEEEAEANRSESEKADAELVTGQKSKAAATKKRLEEAKKGQKGK